MLHAQAANIRCDRYCSTFWEFRVELEHALIVLPTYKLGATVTTTGRSVATKRTVLKQKMVPAA